MDSFVIPISTMEAIKNKIDIKQNSIPISTMEHQVKGTKQVLTTIKSKDELKKGDKVIFRRGNKYKQWNDLVEQEYCGGEVISVNKKTITLHLYELEKINCYDEVHISDKEYPFCNRYTWGNKKNIWKKGKEGETCWFRFELKEVDSSSLLFKNNITKVNDYDFHFLSAFNDGKYEDVHYFKWNEKWVKKQSEC